MTLFACQAMKVKSKVHLHVLENEGSESPVACKENVTRNVDKIEIGRLFQSQTHNITDLQVP